MSQTVPLSLAAYFTPPTDSVGVFAMLTGYSADYHFLNDALEKFTQNIKSQRAYEGGASLALMLDEKHVQITAVDCPGLIHLASNPAVGNKFKLLHAKVALLLFKNKNTAQQTIRLVVSTGNWTRQTLEDSLDLVWSIDDEVGEYADEQTQTDIAKAYDFITYTLGFFDDGLLNSKRSNKQPTLTSLRYKQFKDALSAINLVKDIKPRFFDSRDHSLLAQLPELVSSHASTSKRNYLCIGSGFYEGGDLAGQMPMAITAIEQTLRKSDLLTQNPSKDIYVNPHNCQAVAESTAALNKRHWQVRSAFDAVYEGKNHQRTLHAKFIFSAFERGGKCLSPWLYLGSGNITAPGFLNKASQNGGNLEAGIVFSPEGLTWDDKDNSGCSISQKLPINWDDEKLITEEQQVSAGGEMPEHDGQYIAAPVSYFIFSKGDDDLCWLLPSEVTHQEYQVLTPGSEICEFHQGKVLWRSVEPRQVLVSWQNGDCDVQTYVPIFDELGRLAATGLPELELDDAWMLLGAFPTLPSEDNENGEVEIGASRNEQSDSGNSDYHINKMMTLIEYIAQKQTSTDEFDWSQWCHRLEQTFSQLGTSRTIHYFQTIGINPLSPLWAKPFRPSFAEDHQSDSGRLYEQVLSKIEVTLKLTSLLALGGEYE
jgi:hypothetical protein